MGSLAIILMGPLGGWRGREGGGEREPNEHSEMYSIGFLRSHKKDHSHAKRNPKVSSTILLDLFILLFLFLKFESAICCFGFIY
jgi:hypothetical protein